ncbi:hypothetical protein EQG49_00285 [Periweissella cryptocerci]|uniref:Uncharacterized protein n=1 Tax=Periweissella cryptocerci TaxID=2506420 RepID=A0A4P6YQY0_9LACO|nr:hypothetical protein [Periweissella cryptocerci]QBO34992.1 hypothetical protein EQG49_00285 [Periweissella cryptocerci]
MLNQFNIITVVKVITFIILGSATIVALALTLALASLIACLAMFGLIFLTVYVTESLGNTERELNSYRQKKGRK